MHLFLKLPPWRWRIGLAVVAIAVVAFGVVQASFQGARAAPAAPVTAAHLTALTVTIAAPQTALWPDVVTASGAIAAWQEATVAALVSGQPLATLQADIGDVVHRDQILAAFDSDSLRLTRDQLVAQRDEARAVAEQAAANLVRATRIHRAGNLSDQELLQAQTNVKTGEAQVNALTAQLASAELQLARCVVRAPDDGVITARSATLGMVATNGQALFTLQRQSRLEWRGELTAAQRSLVAVGQPIQLILPDGGTASAVVRQLAPTLDGQTRLATVYADVLPGSTARAGMYVQGQIRQDNRPALVVPAASIVIRDGHSGVFVVRAGTVPARATWLPVDTGRRQESWVEIRPLTELAGTDVQVVVQGAGLLVDGDNVRIADRSEVAS